MDLQIQPLHPLFAAAATGGDSDSIAGLDSLTREGGDRIALEHALDEGAADHVLGATEHLPGSRRTDLVTLTEDLEQEARTRVARRADRQRQAGPVHLDHIALELGKERQHLIDEGGHGQRRRGLRLRRRALGTRAGDPEEPGRGDHERGDTWHAPRHRRDYSTKTTSPGLDPGLGYGDYRSGKT